ncbi:helix-turn-helix domain-containing protein [Pseudobythopirellula maris]|uniref:helix-turn-helix domain-containing protein n=1 Tax=Pseudobythopirellula maris TaxID=2527991 RepID=UPI0011B7748E|nr:helix-turn-helix transcriptional regulator [Pseudobythopirellula maris]
MSTSEKQSTSGIGDRLRWAREQSGLSQGQVAKLLDMHRPTVSQIEAGSRSLKAEEVSWFAELYDISSAWLLQGDDESSSSGDPRIQLAARELSKLSPEDLQTLLRLVKALRSNKE